MTAKKDLKKSKSKKKVKKYNQKNYKKKEETVVQTTKKKGFFANYAKTSVNDKNIAILSLVESLILMAFIIMMIFVKPGDGIGGQMIEQNKVIAEVLGVGIAKYIMVGIIGLCFIIYILGYNKNKEYKSFYTSGMTFLAVEILFIVTQSIKSFELYGYGLVLAIFMTIVEMLKYFYMVKYLKKIYGN